jgi:hypothetical protein
VASRMTASAIACATRICMGGPTIKRYFPVVGKLRRERQLQRTPVIAAMRSLSAAVKGPVPSPTAMGPSITSSSIPSNSC